MRAQKRKTHTLKDKRPDKTQYHPLQNQTKPYKKIKPQKHFCSATATTNHAKRDPQKAGTHTQAMMNFSGQLTCVSLQTLGSHEDRDTIDKWWSQLKCHLRNTQFKDVMLQEWSTGTNRGFSDEKIGDKTITAASKSNLVENMLEQIVGFMPEIAPSAIIPKATSLNWVYEHLRTTLRLRKDRP